MREPQDRAAGLDPAARMRKLIDCRRERKVGRREFMRQMTALLGVCGLPPALADTVQSDPAPSSDVFWPTITAVQTHLWPAHTDAPAIADFNASAYLGAALLDPQIEADERQYISDGVAPLEDFTRAQFERSFFELDAAEREAVLRKIETSPAGRYWLSLIIYYLLEALVSDPVYGGNTDTIGWRWLEHQPGFPRPPAAYPYDGVSDRA
jgi:gluconate 2-dehydrogenase gamma chain